MPILDQLQSASIRLIGQKPQAFFGSANTFELELCDLINEVAQDVAKYRDWQALVKFAPIVGNGTATAFDLPAAYDRQMIVTDIQDTQGPFWGYSRIVDVNAFVNLSNSGILAAPGAWAVYGNQIHFAPAPSSGAAATYPYITSQWAIDAGGSPKSAFTSDTDSFVLPDRLLTLGLVWRWRENKKLDASGDMENFTKALDEYAAKDGGSRVIRESARRSWPGARLAWPWELG